MQKDINTAHASWQPHTKPFKLKDSYTQNNNSKICVIHYWAEWNGCDLKMDRLIQKIKPDFEDSIIFRSCDIDKEKDRKICNEKVLLNVPALAFFLNGHHIETLIGIRPEDEIRKKLNDWLEKKDKCIQPSLAGDGLTPRLKRTFE